MKIGILTLPLHCNYGGILQAYALQEFLRKEGHEVVLLDRQKNRTDERFGARCYSFLCKQIMHRNMQNYIHSHLHCSTPLRSTKDLEQAASTLDAVIVGSDQVWRLGMIKGVETNYFLDFVPNGCKRIAYAASFGMESWKASLTLTDEIRQLLTKFQAISVREEEGVWLCKEVFDIETTQVSDPTLLFDRSFYEGLLPTNQKVPNDTLFYYLLGNKKERQPIIESLAKKLGKQPYTINAQWETHLSKFTFAYFPTPDQWIDGFNRAGFVVTDSFHGIIFSLLFNKPFVVLKNYAGGLSRITSLLERYGLLSHLVEEDELLSVSPDNLQTPPYHLINKSMDEDRKRSAEFLRHALLTHPNETTTEA